MVGHVGFGINSCSWIQFSKDDLLTGIEGCNLYLDGNKVSVGSDGSIAELGQPISNRIDKEGHLVFEYPQYSLALYIEESGSPTYLLGTMRSLRAPSQ